MCLRKRCVLMSERYREIDFSLYGREGDALVLGVVKFEYLG